MAGFMTFPVLTRVAGTRAGPIPRVKYGSGVKTGPASRLVGWANIQPAPLRRRDMDEQGTGWLEFVP